MKHDWKANLKSAPPPPSSFSAHCVCAPYTSMYVPVCMLRVWVTPQLHECVHEWSSKCQGVCEDMYGCFTSRWLIARLPPPRCRRRFWHRSAALNRLCDRTRRDQTDSIGTLHKTTIRLQVKECDEYTTDHCDTAPFLPPGDFLITKLGRWEVAKLWICL